MKIQKHRVLLALFLITGSLISQVYWTNQSSPVSVLLYRCDFTDTLNGWACGDSGTIVHTANGGANWTKQITNIIYNVEGINFVNKRLGWGIANDYTAYRTYILNTSNGGEIWNAVPYTDSTIILGTIYFLDSLNGYMGGYNGNILKTTDAGASWNRMQVDSSLYSYFKIERFRFFNSKIGVACGGVMDFGGVIWRTTNYGLNWRAFSIAPEPIFDILYVDSMKAFATGGDFEFGPSFVKTHNNWEDWNYNALGYFGIGRSIAVRTPKEFWIPLGFSRAWAVSIDTGNNWTYVLNSNNSGVYDALFVDSTHGWAVGYSGKIYKFNSQIIGVNPNGNVLSSFTLYQNYPNPFNPKTVIRYELRAAAFVNLSVFDVTGKHLIDLINRKQDAGKYEVDFPGSGLASGVYFYRLTAGDYSETRKMVLAK
jgi:photosystem II stability/assembly factor-like uncharacterized protein